MSKIILAIPDILAQREINATAFASMTDLSYGAAHGLATGRTRRLDLSTIEAVCDALDVEPGELFKRDTPRVRTRKAAKR